MARHKLKKRDIHGPRTFYDVRLDLHGMFSEEAMRKVEKTIAANPGRSILVIHGHGTGAFSGMPSGARFRRIACRWSGIMFSERTSMRRDLTASLLFILESRKGK